MKSYLLRTIALLPVIGLVLATVTVVGCGSGASPDTMRSTQGKTPAVVKVPLPGGKSMPVAGQMH